MSETHSLVRSPEHGQANVQLAVIASLKKHHGDEVDIYIVSYESFRSRVPAGVTFKPVLGRGLNEYHKGTSLDTDNPHRASTNERVRQAQGSAPTQRRVSSMPSAPSSRL